MDPEEIAVLADIIIKAIKNLSNLDQLERIAHQLERANTMKLWELEQQYGQLHFQGLLDNLSDIGE